MSGENVFGWLKVVVILLATVVLGILIWKGWDFLKKTVDFFDKGSGQAVNPLSTNNAIYKAVSAPISAATGGDSLGTWLASIFSAEARAASRAVAPLKPIKSTAPIERYPNDW